MAVRTIAMFLYVGQGMSTLIENYNDGNGSNVPDHLVLVDFGGNQKYADPAAAYVTAKLKAQQDAGRKATLDWVVISHQDHDHLSLLPYLVAKIQEQGVALDIGGIFCGGARWSKRNQNTVRSFVELDAALDVDDVEFAEPAQSHYVDPAHPTAFVTFNNVWIRVLLSGYVPPNERRDDIIKNASSAVVVIDNGAAAVVLPGDATYHTMGQINDMMAQPNWIHARPAPLSPVTALEIPHHGALRTAVEDYTARGTTDDFDFSIINQFSANMNPRAIVSSAGPRNTHNHPLAEVINVFRRNLEAAPVHTYVAYVFDKPKAHKVDGWEQFTTNRSIFTTVLTFGPGGYTWGNFWRSFPATGLTVAFAPYLTEAPHAEAAADPSRTSAESS